MEVLVVAAAIIQDRDKFLIAQRNPGSQIGLLWEFPGGKLEEDEEPENCLVREIQEELDFDIEVEDIFHVVTHNYDTRRIIMLCYMCRVKGGTPKCIDCHDFRWVTLDEAGAYEFAPADYPVLQKLIARYGMN